MVEASIIVPTRNRARLLGQCLMSLVEQSAQPGRFEIVVVDNTSADDTAALVARFVSLHRHHTIRYIREPIPGLLSGRHRGTIEARADILCFIDDDIIADPDWLQCVLTEFNTADVHLVGGPSIGKFEVSPPSWVEPLTTCVPEGRFLDSLSLIDLGSARREIAAYFVWGLNFNIRKRTLLAMGGFHPDGVPLHLVRYRGDGEGGLSSKVIEAGYKTRYHPGAKVTHVIGQDRLSVEYFKRRRFLQGISDSYTAIRRSGSSDGVEHRPPDEQFLHAVDHDPDVRLPQLRREFEGAYADGFSFHVNAVRTDADLLAWVLRSDYLHDYDYGRVRTTATDALPVYFQPRGNP